MKQITVENMRGSIYPTGESFIANYAGITKLVDAFYDIPEYQDKRINFIGCGSSGVIMATMFAAREPMRSFIVAIKKEKEYSNHPNYDMRLMGEINVIVDDFIVSGRTLNYIYSEIEQYMYNTHIHAICTQGYCAKPGILKFKADYELSLGKKP